MVVFAQPHMKYLDNSFMNLHDGSGGTCYDQHIQVSPRIGSSAKANSVMELTQMSGILDMKEVALSHPKTVGPDS